VFSLMFWKSAAERAVKSFAQALAACLAAGTGFEGVNWEVALSVSGMTALLSVLTSVASLPVGDHASPSLVAPPSEGAVVPGQRQPEVGAIAAT
jgi:hypothetical protein